MRPFSTGRKLPNVKPFRSLSTALVTALLLPVLIFPVLPLQADELPRRTYLGLQFDLQDRSGPGLLVADVLPRSTALLAGMRPGDRLTSVGHIDVLEFFSELREEIARTEAGQRIALRWYRGSNRVHRVSPPLGTLPMEVVPNSLVRYETVRVDGTGQRLILSEPLGGAKGLVLFLQGLGCTSYDFWLDTENPIKHLIDGWARSGYATARLEKRGAGDSEGNCADLNFEDERRGFTAAIAHLRAAGFDGRIFLFGHGLGGLLAPLVATSSVAGVMVYGTVGEPWYDYMMESFERQDRLAGIDDQRLEERQALRAEFQRGLLFEGERPAVLKEAIAGSEDLEDVQMAAPDHYSGRSVGFFVQLAALDPARVWRQVWQPVLALHGEYDWISSRVDHERIAGLSGGKFLSMTGLDHRFLRYGSLQESFQARGTGIFAPAVIEATVAWMQTIPLTAPTELRGDAAGAGPPPDLEPNPEPDDSTSAHKNR